MISITHTATVSSQPPMKPAMSPRQTPMIVVITVTDPATMNDGRAP